MNVDRTTTFMVISAGIPAEDHVLGLRFRQSFELFPGARLNLSGSGLSVSFGVPGATVNVGAKGLRTTVGIPGTGLSFSHLHGRPEGNGSQIPALPRHEDRTPLPTPQFYMLTPAMREIGSAAVEHLTSAGLRELRDVIRQARKQRAQVDADLEEAEVVHRDEVRELERREGSFFRFFYKKRIASLRDSVPVARAEIDRLKGWRETTHVDMDFDIGAEAARRFGILVRAFEGLRNSLKIWDLTSDRDIDRFRERSAASRAVDRKPAVLDFSSSPIVRFDGRAMRFENVNGEDILLYPGMVLMPRPDGAFALVDLRELEIRFDARQFVEDDAVPSDAKVVGSVWAKTNKDGSPDRRFRDNRQIPVCLYGHLEFRSPGGIREEYQFSDARAAAVFADAFSDFKASLPVSTQRNDDISNL